MSAHFPRRVVAASVAGLAAVVLAGCGTATESAAPTTDTDAPITIATTQQLSSINGLVGVVDEINLTLYSPLTKVDGDGALVAGLATEWTSNDDATEWTFTIRDDAGASDGSTLGPDDVKFSYDTIAADDASLQRSNVANVAEVEVVGDAVVFTMVSPMATFPRAASLVPIVPAAAYAEMGPEEFSAMPVSTGPYAVSEYNGTDEMVLVPNENYYGEAPAFSNVIVRTVTDETTRLNGLQSGEYDVASISANALATAEAVSELDVSSIASNQAVYLGFNTDAEGLESPELRAAVSYAIDRAGIISAIFADLAEPNVQVVAPATVGYDEALVVPEQDLPTAEEMVAASGYDGTPIALSFPSDGTVPLANETAQAVAGALQEAGIAVELQAMPAATFVSDWFSKKLPGMFLYQFQPTTLDSATAYGYLLDSAAYFTDEDLLALLSESNAEPDEAAREALLTEIATVINDEAYYVGIHTPMRNLAYDAGIDTAASSRGLILPEFLAPAE